MRPLVVVEVEEALEGAIDGYGGGEKAPAEGDSPVFVKDGALEAFYEAAGPAVAWLGACVGDGELGADGIEEASDLVSLAGEDADTSPAGDADESGRAPPESAYLQGMESDGGPTRPSCEGQVEKLSRPQALELLRRKLKSLTDEDHCMCAAAAKAGVFCRGFARLSDQEFRSRFDWIVRKRPRTSRSELEKIVNLYHLGRQEVTGTALCCDLETREHTSCDGWNTFDNPTLEAFCQELLGRAIRIV